jgi:hypothetical protein
MLLGAIQFGYDLCKEENRQGRGFVEESIDGLLGKSPHRVTFPSLSKIGTAFNQSQLRSCIYGVSTLIHAPHYWHLPTLDLEW